MVLPAPVLFEKNIKIVTLQYMKEIRAGAGAGQATNQGARKRRYHQLSQ